MKWILLYILLIQPTTPGCDNGPYPRPPIPMVALVIVAACALMFSACSGSISTDDNHAGTGPGGNPGSREQLFIDEAVERVLDTVHTTCTEIVCPFADDEREDEFRGEILQTQCSHHCVEVEFDNEVRHYRVVIHWQRFLDRCYVPEPFRIWSVLPVNNLCIPNF